MLNICNVIVLYKKINIKAMERKLTFKQPVQFTGLLGHSTHQKFLPVHPNWCRRHLCSQRSSLGHRVMLHSRIWEHGDFCLAAGPNLAKPAAHVPCCNQRLLRAHAIFAQRKSRLSLKTQPH